MTFAEKRQLRSCKRHELSTHHEIPLDKVQLLRKAFLGCIPSSTLDLIIVIVQASDVTSRKFGNFASWSPDTTANIENLHSLLDANGVGKIMLMSGNGLSKRFSICKSAKVERLAPSILVKVGYEVIIARSTSTRRTDRAFRQLTVESM
jgi:hypothetical protein